MEKPIVISVGGSLIVPKDIDLKFLQEFKTLILRHIEEGKRFVVITGGGNTARVYQDAVRNEASSENLDWIGIAATQMNADLLQSLFGSVAHWKVVQDPTAKVDFKEKILFAGGWKPGWSSDYCAVALAKNLGAETVINLSNIDYVYDKDPREFPDAKKIEDITWKEFRKIIPAKWDPGLHSPFDPVASELAEKAGLEVVVMNGKKLENLDLLLSQKKFIGTRIRL